jgi:hypothetical protein
MGAGRDEVLDLTHLRTLLNFGGHFRGGRGRRRYDRSDVGIDPAGVNQPVQGIRSITIDVPLPDNATQGHLNVAGRAAEPVVKVKMTEGGVEIVGPQEADHTRSKPKAFGVRGRTAKDLLGLDVYVNLLAAVGAGITDGGAVGGLWTDTLGNCGLVGPAQEGHAEEGSGNTHATEVHVLTY